MDFLQKRILWSFIFISFIFNCIYPVFRSNRSSEQINGTIIRAIAKLPTLAAWSYKNRVRQPIVYPQNNLSYTANFMHMMFALPTTLYVNQLFLSFR